MAVRPDDSGVNSQLTALLSFLQGELGGLFFDNPGTPPQDKAWVNLIRLRALFEQTGDQQLLKQQVGTKLVTIHDLVLAVDDDRLKESVTVLFGQKGTAGPNVTGEIGSGAGRAEARALVDAQWAQMEEAGGVGAASPQAGAPQQEDPTGVLAPEPSQGADVDEIRAGNQQGLDGTDGATGDAAGGGGGSGGTDIPLDDTLGEDVPNQIPGGGELWKVDGKAVYLAYTIPGTDTKMVWLVENPERLQAIFGTSTPTFDKELSRDEFRAMSPWNGGLSAEIVNTSEDPWQVFLNKWEKATDLRPWLADPKFQAVAAVAYLEGREPTHDELQETDWWNDHTADERAWMEDSVTLGTGEVERRFEDAKSAVAEALRKAGMNNVPKHISDYIAGQRLTGKWSETYTSEQVRKLSDPYAAGKLDKGLLAMIRDPDLGSTADARAIAGGKPALKERIRAIFDNARVDLSKHGDGSAADPEERLDRLATEVLSGARTMTDIRQSVDILATKTTGGRVGGLDVNVEGEDRVRGLLREWVGPAVAAGYSDAWIAEQAGLLRNDPDYEQVLVEKLQAARMGAFGNWQDPTLKYEDIAPVARQVFARVWGQTPDETDPLFMDVVNMQDQNAAAAKLRKEGISRGVGKVVDDALAGLSDTALGQQVIRSTV